METVQTQTKKTLKPHTQRILTGIVYVIVWVALSALKWGVPAVKFGDTTLFFGSLGFDAAFCAISVIGGIELIRAAKGLDGGRGVGISVIQRAFTIAFCAIMVPLYALMEMMMPGTGFLGCACAFTVYLTFLAATCVFDHGNSTVKGFVFCLFTMVYCGVLPAVFSAINHLQRNSMTAVLTLFMCTVFTDCGAYLVGKTLKRFIPAKLAPKLSPNKTVIGAIGGLIGGVLGGLLVYVLIMSFGGMNGGAAWLVSFNSDIYLTFTSKAIHPAVTFVLIGVFTSVMAQVGDLFESAVKRECGVKDMGKILPGHGGVLDRFDSMLYCSTIVLFMFGTVVI